MQGRLRPSSPCYSHRDAPFHHCLCMVLFVCLLCSGLLTRPAQAEPTSPAQPAEAQALWQKSAKIESDIKGMLFEIKSARRQLLEKNRNEILEELQNWRDGDDMDARDYHRRLEEALLIAESYGMDIDKMRQVHELMKQTILRMEFIDPNNTGQGTLEEFTGSIYEYFDWAHGEEERIAKAQEQRVAMYKKAFLAYLDALVERDPELAYEKFRKYLGAIQSMAEGEAGQLIAEAEMIVATQKLVVDISAGVPLLGDAMDILALYSGEDLSGHKLTGLEKGLTGFFTLGIPVIGQVVKRAGPSIKQGLGKLVAAFQDATVSQRHAMAEALQTTSEAIEQMVKKISSFDEVQDAISSGRRALQVLKEIQQAIMQRIEAMRSMIQALREGAQAAKEATQEAFDRLAREVTDYLDELPARKAEEYSQRLSDMRREFAEALALKELREMILANTRQLDTILAAARQHMDMPIDALRAKFDEIAARIREAMKGLPEGEASALRQKLDQMKQQLDELLEAITGAQRAARDAFMAGLEDLTGKLDALKRGDLSPAEFLQKLKETQNHLKKLDPEESKVLGDALLDVERQFRDELDRLAREGVELSDEASELQRAWHAGEQAALDKVAEIQRLLDAGRANRYDPEFLEAYMAIRKDKRALTELKALGEQYKDLRTAIRQVEDSILADVDELTMNELRKALRGNASGEVANLSEAARKRIENAVRSKAHEAGIVIPPGTKLEDMIDLSKVEIGTFKATNKVPSPDDLGMDRDITFQLFIKEINGQPVSNAVVDIPADLAAASYHKHLYESLNPGQPSLTGEALRNWGAHDMDHVVTDALATDAYRLDLDIREFFKDPSLIATQRQQLADFADTVFYKSDEWFERSTHHFADADAARRAGNSALADELTVRAMSETTEGARQALKQYDRYMSALLDDKLMNQAAHVPAQVRQGMEVFRKLQNRQISYPQAMEMLRQLGVSPSDVVRDFSEHFRMIVNLESTTRQAVQSVQ